VRLSKGDVVVTAWAESCGGPGWANTPVWVLVQRRDSSFAIECLQPREQTDVMLLLHSTSAHIARLMTAETRRVLAPAKKRKAVKP
jgi:hypothetical protein